MQDPPDRWSFKVLALLLGSILGLLAVEVVARLEGSYARHLAAIDRQKRWLESRQREPAPQDGGEPRIEILALGDSFTFGILLREDEAWPAVLERRLNERFGHGSRRFSVPNLARPGAGLEDHLEILRGALEERAPALVLHQLFFNDFTVKRYRQASRIPAYRGPPDQVLVRSLPLHALFYLHRFLIRYPLNRDSFLDWTRRFAPRELPHWRLAAEDYRKIAQLAREKNVVLVSFLVPAQLWHGESYPLEELERSIRAAVEPLAPHFLELLPYLRENLPEGRDHWVDSDLPDAHPDALTHRLYADALLASLESSGLLPLAQTELVREVEQDGDVDEEKLGDHRSRSPSPRLRSGERRGSDRADQESRGEQPAPMKAGDHHQAQRKNVSGDDDQRVRRRPPALSPPPSAADRRQRQGKEEAATP